MVKLLQEGYELFPTAKEFLKEFGYLEVKYHFHPQYHYEAFSIHPRHIFLERVMNSKSQKIGTRIFYPLG
jgi:hypothetical protein